MLLAGFLFISLGAVKECYADVPYRHYASGCNSGDFKGVSAEIYTINPNIPNNPNYVDYVAVFVNILFNAAPLHWIQVGYNKGEDSPSPNSLVWYVEKNDTNGPQLFWLEEGPQAGEWYTYKIEEGPANTFDIWIGGTKVKTLTLNLGNERCIQISGQVEVSNDNINVINSHFKNLQYYDGTNWKDWQNLDTHITIPGYDIKTSGTTEFWIVKKRGGAGCPTLFVWNGEEYAEEGILNIHAEMDITVQHVIQNSLALEKHVAKIQLRELDEYTSHIDQVKLYVIDYHGKAHPCPLIYAYHNQLGAVTQILRLDDGKRVDLRPGEIIDLKFVSLLNRQTAYFIFEINGYNMKWTGAYP